MKIDLTDRQNIFDLFNHEIIANRQLAKIDHLEGKITKPTLNWKLKHADYLEDLMKEVLTRLTK